MVSVAPTPERVTDRVWLVRGSLDGVGTICMYVLRGSQLAVIDTGFTHHPAHALTPALRLLGLGLDEVDVILNTHGHPDHLGGNASLKDASGATVHLHAADVPLAGGPEAHMRARCDLMDTLRALGWLDQLAEREVFLRQRVGRDVGVDRLLEEDDVVDLGADLRLRVVHMPGHTPGSVTFFLDSENLAFTGDAVQAWGGRAGALPLYFDAPAYAASIERLREIQPATLCMAHPVRWSGAMQGASPVRVGAEARQTLDDSLAFVRAAERAAAAAMTADPVGTEAFVRLALDALEGPFAFRPDAAKPFAAAAATALLAHRNAAIRGTSIDHSATTPMTGLSQSSTTPEAGDFCA